MEKMDIKELENLALLLKNNRGDISKGMKKVCLTTHVLSKVNDLINVHVKQLMTNSTIGLDVRELNSSELIKQNIETIFQLIQTITHLKLIADVMLVDGTIDISEFSHLKVLEIQKIDISKVTGLSTQRIHLQHLICVRSLDSIKDLLEDCGGDFCSRYIWSELKNLVLSYNNLRSLDNSLESTPWLNSLDLSHNELTSVDEVNYLGNLKHLNLSFNKLQKLPKFNGQICNRLQILNVSNNFLEDIEELEKLLNISELDISDNCLIDHSILQSISHMSTLQCLTLTGNPLACHIRHTHNTCIYLHANIEPQRFILDYKQLTSSDIKLIGTFHPLMRKSNSESLNNLEGSMKLLTSTEKYKRVREVDIEDTKSVEKIAAPPINSYSSINHLEVKNHIENLREMYGESWLNYYSGLQKNNPKNDSQDISGFSILDETSDNLNENEEKNINETNGIEEAKDETVVETNIYNTSIVESSDEDDIEVNSDETIYMAQVSGEEQDLFVVFTNETLTEIDCTTSKERASWVLNTITTCEIIDEARTIVEVNFDTLRKDRKQRLYVLQNEDAERFYNFLLKIVNNRKKPTLNKVFQCMKCLKQFPKNEDLMASYKEEVVQCTNCGSTILVEEHVTAEND